MFDNNEMCKNHAQGANRSSVKLYERLESLTAEWDKRIYDSKDIDDKWFARRGKEQALANTIATTMAAFLPFSFISKPPFRHPASYGFDQAEIL